MTNKSKIKGTTYEYKIRDIFTDHFKIEFERVPTSGALPYLKGDIWSPTHLVIFPYTVECKHYKELEFNNLLTAKSNDLLSFWQQAIDEAKVMKKKPLVVFRWNRSKDFVMWNDEDIKLDDFVIHYKGFGLEFNLAELSKWLPHVKIKLN